MLYLWGPEIETNIYLSHEMQVHSQEYLQKLQVSHITVVEMSKKDLGLVSQILLQIDNLLLISQILIDYGFNN